MQMVSLSRAHTLIKALVFRAICEAALLNYILQLHKARHAGELYTIKKLLTAPVIHRGKTSLKPDKKSIWCMYTLLVMSRSNVCTRNAEATQWAVTKGFRAMAVRSFITSGCPASGIPPALIWRSKLGRIFGIICINMDTLYQKNRFSCSEPCLGTWRYSIARSF